MESGPQKNSLDPVPTDTLSIRGRGPDSKERREGGLGYFARQWKIIFAAALVLMCLPAPPTFGQTYNLGAFWRQQGCSTISYVGGSNPGVANSTTTTASLSVTSGELVVAGVYFGNAVNTVQAASTITVSDSLGNTWYAGPVENNAYAGNPFYGYSGEQLWFSSITVPGSDTVTATQTGNSNPYTGVFLAAYSGVATSNPVDASAGQIAPTAGTTTVSTGNLTATESCADLVVALFDYEDTPPLTPSGGWTSRQSATSGTALFALIQDDLPGGAAKNAVVNASATETSQDNSWAASEIAFRAAGSTTPAQPTQIAFTTSGQTLSDWSCSSAVTVQSESSGAAATPPQSPISISLSGSSATFYSDSACTYPITSTSIGIGATTATFYFEYSSAGTYQITATPGSGLSAISQNETVNAGTTEWVGGASCDGNWTTGACWGGGSAPTSAQIAHFDGNCSVNCSATLNTSPTIGGLYLHSSMSSSASVSVGSNTLTIGTAIATQDDYVAQPGWPSGNNLSMVLEGGILNSGSGAIVMSGMPLVVGGTWNGNSATITARNGFWLQTGTWNEGTSTVDFKSVTTDEPSFYNLVLVSGNNGSNNLSGYTFSNNLTINSGASWGTNGATMTVAGNWTNNGTYTPNSSESTTFTAGANHTIGGSSSTTFGSLIMDNSASATSNTLTFAAGTTTKVNSTTTLKGNSTNALNLRSSSPGTQWKFNPATTSRTVNYVNVEDSDNTNATAVSATNSVDSGDNTNWTLYNAPVQVQNPVAYDSSSCTTCTIGVAATGSGNLLVVAVAWAGGATVSGVTDNASTANTYSLAESASTTTSPAGGTALYYAQNSNSGATTITVTLSSASTPSIFVYEYSGMLTSGALDSSAVSAKSNASASHNVTGASVTTTAAAEVIFSVAYGPGTITGIKSGNAFTGSTIQNGDDAGIDQVSATGTYNAAWSQTSSDTYSVSTAGFKIGTN